MPPPPGAPTLPRTTHLSPMRTSRHAQQPSSTSSRSTSQIPASSGSQTVTATPSPESEMVLRLRGSHEPSTQTYATSRQRIQWAEGTVDNEGLGRKKSKVCCIYHKEHPVGESSDESSSSSDDSDSDVEDGNARMVGGERKARGRRNEHGGCDHGKGKRKPSPNAYEKMPKYDVKSLKQTDKVGI